MRIPHGCVPGGIPALFALNAQGLEVTMTQGTVRWFNLAKGYGFITADEGDDVFVRFNAIQAEGLRKLSDGQRVEFVMEADSSGAQASSVRSLTPA